MRSTAAIGDGVGGFTIEEVELAPPGPGEVLVALRASGLCHTDHDSKHWGRPVVLGHEGAGVVAAVGDGVTRVVPGDAVVLNWAIPCGACFQCARGALNLCEESNHVTAGSRGDTRRTTRRGVAIERAFHLGTLSTHTVVRAAACVRLDVPIPFRSACLLGCGVMTGVGSALRAARVAHGSSAVVLGAGGVGLNVIQGCRLAGAGTILAVDVVPSRLELARAFGATEVLLARRDDAGLAAAAATARARLGGRGADYAFECTAVPELAAAPLAFVRNGGTAIAVSGVEQPVTIDMSLFEWDKLYLNPLYGQCRPDEDFPRLMELWASGELLLDELVTRTYALAELGAAFDDLLAGRNAKGVVLFDA